MDSTLTDLANLVIIIDYFEARAKLATYLHMHACFVMIVRLYF